MRLISNSLICEVSPKVLPAIQTIVTNYRSGKSTLSNDERNYIIDVLNRRGGAKDKLIVLALKNNLIDICIDKDEEVLSNTVIPLINGSNTKCIVNIIKILPKGKLSINDLQDLDALRFMLFDALFQQKFYSNPNKFNYNNNIVKSFTDIYRPLIDRVLGRTFNLNYESDLNVDSVEYLTVYFIQRVLFNKSVSESESVASSTKFSRKSDLTSIRMNVSKELENMTSMSIFFETVANILNKPTNKLIFVKNWILNFDKMLLGLDTPQIVLGYMYASSEVQTRTFNTTFYVKIVDYKNVKKLAESIEKVW